MRAGWVLFAPPLLAAGEEEARRLLVLLVQMPLTMSRCFLSLSLSPGAAQVPVGLPWLLLLLVVLLPVMD